MATEYKNREPLITGINFGFGLTYFGQEETKIERESGRGFGDRRTSQTAASANPANTYTTNNDD